MQSPEIATIQILRRDLALQIARFVAESGQRQVDSASDLAIPQPTLSKIMNARVADLSLELLIRIAVRAELPIVLQTGKHPSEAGVYVSRPPAPNRRTVSRLADRARAELAAVERRQTPGQRLETQLEHSELLAELHRSGTVSRAAASPRPSTRRR